MRKWRVRERARLASETAEMNRGTPGYSKYGTDLASETDEEREARLQQMWDWLASETAEMKRERPGYSK